MRPQGEERLGKTKLILLTSPRDKRASSLCTVTWGIPERSGGRDGSRRLTRRPQALLGFLCDRQVRTGV